MRSVTALSLKTSRWMAFMVLVASFLIFSCHHKPTEIKSPALRIKLRALPEGDTTGFARTIDVLTRRMERSDFSSDDFLFSIDSGSIVLRVRNTPDLDRERLRKLLQSSVHLTFNETEDFDQLLPCFLRADSFMLSKEGEQIQSRQLALLDLLLLSHIDSSETQLTGEGSPNEYTLRTPIMGSADVRDTFTIGQMLRNEKIADYFPENITFMWSATNSLRIDDHPRLDLYAIRKGTAFVPGELDDINIQHSSWGPYPRLTLKFNEHDTQLWASISKENVQEEIAIVIDGLVYCCPRVEEPILSGQVEITGIKEAEMETWAAWLRTGPLPRAFQIVEEQMY